MTTRAPSRFLTILVMALTWVGASAAEIHPAGPVAIDTALHDAHRLAAVRDGLQVVRVEGRSMLPFFGDGSVLVVKTMKAETLRAGMVVVYRNRFDETVAHRVEARGDAGWIVRGYNNADADSTAVTDENLLGAVYATFHSSGKPALVKGVDYAALMNATPVALAAPAR